MTTSSPPLQNPAVFQPSELAIFLNGLASHPRPDAQRLRAGAQHFQQLAECPPPAPMTPAQKEDIQQLCTHPLLRRPEKTKLLLAYVRFDKEQAAEAINHLRTLLSAREDMREGV